ncbi:XRE family transcriptional regulator [Oceanobacillus sp. E9]|uniref:helix-turn-helix transcriptional regulator n=1 Tax=Oceanobacillus TaxID=182709 RepID=UPI0003494717|nr:MULTISPECIES: helix-turn-helix transcriptional regulator [Oceanobacillus]OEH53153.1 XRE family transcriptional regulator [Oceanobacillus sp. E9]
MRQWLKEKRIRKGLTQFEVARKSDIERSYFTMIEQGRRNPSVLVAKKIASSLDFEWTLFFDYQCNDSKHIIKEVI